MHKVDAEQMREETILEIVGNQKENQSGRVFNQKDQEIVGIVGN